MIWPTKRAAWIAFGVFASMALASSNAYAYCVTSRDMVTGWGNYFPDLRIPVRLILVGDNSVMHTGRTPQDVARVLIEVIARHNESTTTPKLYFAGFGDGPGIIIGSLSCEKSQISPPCGEAKACAGFDDPNQVPYGSVLITPGECAGVNDDAWEINAYPDIAQVMLHEMGHTLGMSHSNDSKASCESFGQIHGGPIDGANGVMQTAVPASFAAFRVWRRDDLDGLEHLYGAAVRPHEIAWWDDGTYPAYPANQLAQSLIGMPVSRSVAISNRTSSPYQALVTTAPGGRVIHQIMDDSGAITPNLGDEIVDASPSGVTWAMPTVALGTDGVTERIFVAWAANEASDNNVFTLRTAVRSMKSSNWTYSDHPDEFRVARLAAGFAPGASAFVVATLSAGTTEVQLALFDIDGSSLGPAFALDGIQAFDVGGPVCEGGRCLIPFSESVFGGPNYSVVEVDVDPRALSATVISIEVLDPVDTFGRLSLLDNTHELLGATGERRFLLGNYPGLQPDPAAFSANPHTDWPVGVGLWDNEQRRLFQPRTVVCGNGIVQGSETCDDGNGVPGDGCDACVDGVVDGMETGTGDSETGSDFGGVEDGNGCECRTRGHDGPVGGPLALLGLLALALRRRLSCQTSA